jgi:MarR family transcriptional regulator, organic hydroperoxide resistance regulator
MVSQAPEIPAFEQHLHSFLAQRGTDIDAQAAVFNLDHAAMDVINTLEGLALRPHDLTHAGFVLLMTLWITGPRETRELAAVLRVTKGAIVGAVNTLEKRGLVQRVRSDVDRRLVTYELTDSGLDLITRVQKDWRALEVEVTSGLTLEEQRLFASLCRKIAAGARALRREQDGYIEPLNPELFLSKVKKMPNKLAPARARRSRHAAAPH